MQVTSANPMSGIEGRTGLLANLGQALQSTPEFFGDSARPGNMLGGLLVDFGVLTLRPGAVSSYRETPDSLPKLPPSPPAII
ncbi:hypothetical protein M407DRAFT_29089 [Tulasnella calospora MUT 4182]|uniref:Uncharacterized protein n=1 Tax=Tulasnella calospora MUT 4182 TaxID=1051891 RepID=A0A0C3QAT1_9AGAM|nr:hypothetical protein M407DRAFT_29089 [Tulasnella calospora MUT 4182]